MDKPKIVADTNVLVSGLLWSGSPHEIIKLAEKRSILLYSSLPLLEELSVVLGRGKFSSRVEEIYSSREELMESLLNIVEIIRPSVRVSEIKSDPDDNRVLECAVSAGAEFIVSGDLHLLKVKEFINIRIVDPSKFLQIY